jgi:hypothetical protein
MKKGLVICLVNLLISLSVTSTTYGSDSIEKYLITMPGPKAAIAKSWKKLDANRYEFDVDASKKIKDGEINFESLSKSLQSKDFVVSVKGDDQKIVVEFKGSEDDFLQKISKTRIRSAKQGVEIALTSSESDGGIRARTSLRDPGEGEVKAKIVQLGSDASRIMVMAKGPGNTHEIPEKRPIKLKIENFEVNGGEIIFFKPIPPTKDGIWGGQDFLKK